MNDSDDDMGAVAWPGFVDILSSVIMMFVFFVMIVSSALYFHIIIFKSRILSEVSDSISAMAQQKELAKTNRSLTKKIEELTEELKILEQINEENEIQLFKEDSGFAESEEQEIVEDPENRTVTIFFGRDSISITRESEQILTEYVQKFASQLKNGTMIIDIQSNKSGEALNDVAARRLAVARMLNTRNAFLSEEIPTENIQASVSSQDKINDSYNWVTVTFREK